MVGAVDVGVEDRSGPCHCVGDDVTREKVASSGEGGGGGGRRASPGPDAGPELGEGVGQVDGDGGLAHAALAAGDSDDVGAGGKFWRRG